MEKYILLQGTTSNQLVFAETKNKTSHMQQHDIEQ
jgi:hypothetical protein